MLAFAKAEAESEVARPPPARRFPALAGGSAMPYAIAGRDQMFVVSQLFPLDSKLL
jgi:hypothetical protein